MNSPAAVHSLDQTQVEDGATTPRRFVNEFAFHMLVILLGIALAFM